MIRVFRSCELLIKRTLNHEVHAVWVLVKLKNLKETRKERVDPLEERLSANIEKTDLQNVVNGFSSHFWTKRLLV